MPLSQPLTIWNAFQGAEIKFIQGKKYRSRIAEAGAGKPETLINIMLHGMTGPVTVAGVDYAPTADMPSLGMNPMFTDQKLADIATYVRNEWNNKAPAVTADTVKKQREATKDVRRRTRVYRSRVWLPARAR